MSGPVRMPTAAATALRWVLWHSLGSIGGLEVHGEFPAGGGFIVVGLSHVSHADAATVMAVLGPRRRSRTASAADYWFATRVRRLAVTTIGNGFAVRRHGGGGTEDLLGAVAFLQAGGVVVIFPEGTRRQGGQGRWHNGAEVLAAAAGVPMVPLAISGTGSALPVGSRLPRFVPVRVDIGTGVPAGTDLASLRLDGGVGGPAIDLTATEEMEHRP